MSLQELTCDISLHGFHLNFPNELMFIPLFKFFALCIDWVVILLLVNFQYVFYILVHVATTHVILKALFKKGLTM